MAEQNKTNEGVKASQVEISGRDVELAVRMAVKMLNDGNGLQVIREAIQKSQDPAMVIGQFLAQMMGKLGERLAKEVGLDPRVFLAKDGFLDVILDYIEQKLGFPGEFSEQIYAQVLETIKAAAQQPPAPNNAMDPNAAPPPGGPQAPPRGGALDGSQ